MHIRAISKFTFLLRVLRESRVSSSQVHRWVHFGPREKRCEFSFSSLQFCNCRRYFIYITVLHLPAWRSQYIFCTYLISKAQPLWVKYLLSNSIFWWTVVWHLGYVDFLLCAHVHRIVLFISIRFWARNFLGFTAFFIFWRLSWYLPWQKIEREGAYQIVVQFEYAQNPKISANVFWCCLAGDILWITNFVALCLMWVSWSYVSF